jgi:hypothetical protein
VAWGKLTISMIHEGMSFRNNIYTFNLAMLTKQTKEFIVCVVPKTREIENLFYSIKQLL